MDKFGIFNLLNSLLSKNSSEISDNSQQNSGVENFLSSLISPKKQPEKSNATKISPPSPLQSSMLGTISSHDAFIKRVKEKNKQ